MKIKIAMSVIFIAASIVILMPLHNTFHFTDSKKDAEASAYEELVATHLYDVMERMFSEPITISREMAANSLLKNLLLQEDIIPSKDTENAISEYLTTIKDEFGYIAAFVVSEKSRCYYTPSGISKIVNPELDPYDIWYQKFLDSHKELDLDTDRDQLNDFRWTVFVNVRIQDKDGTYMGTCGVGLFMDELQKFVELCEEKYGLKVNLIDDKGLVQVDVDASNIENAYISDALTDQAGTDTFTYVKKAFGGFRMTRYIKDLDWYLVVQSSETPKKEITTWLIPLLSFLLLAALYALGIIVVLTRHPHTLIKTQLPEDPLTGLPNRNYLNASYGELGVFNTTRYKSLAMFDIDRFKIINETMNGDEIILRIVELSKDMIDNKGIIFRWSGDEFVFFLEMEASEAEEKFKELCKTIQDELEVTISVGIVEIDLFETIKKNYHRAVQHCYRVKEAGGNGVSRK